MKKKPKDREFWLGIYTLATVGMNLVAATFIGLGIGWVIDARLIGWEKRWFTLVFLILGIIAGFKNIFKIVRNRGDTGAKMDERDDPDRNGH